ncbi:MAG: sigma-70 family RNA polymerase sigma factor [Saprospiraceae bacterium]|nr:sigma-70 family RNA polymerase sigma factor [Saprospiraceae bacterium]
MALIDEQLEQNTIERIKLGDRVFLKDLYQRHRQEFTTWVKRQYRVDESYAAETYQNAFTALYYNVREGKLQVLTSQIKTYLFAIGRNQLRDRLKSDRKFVDLSEDFEFQGVADHDIMEKYEKSHIKDLVSKLLIKIGEPCETVLKLYYFKHFSMEAIAAHMNYKSEQIAAKRKFICLKQIREIMVSQKSSL